jgi:hypothetical protein
MLTLDQGRLSTLLGHTPDDADRPLRESGRCDQHGAGL